MEKQNTLALFALAICALLLGGIVTYVALPREVEVEVVKSVPVLTEKVVFVDKPVEVIKEVEVEVEKIVSLDLEATYLDPAIEAFMDEVEDDDDLLVCDGEEYDFDSIAVKKIYDGYAVSVDDKDDEEFSVSFTAKLKYLDSDVEEKCYRTFDVVVSYPTDDDDDVEVDVE